MVAFLITVAISIAISVVLTVAKMLLFPAKKPEQAAVPKPADGKYNFKQNVPSMTRVYGRVKKPGDYVFLEERYGRAEHVFVMAGHRIEGVVKYYLHDAVVVLNGDGGVTTPSHFQTNVALYHKVGLPLETAWPNLLSLFGDIWTVDHRGDGLAQINMGVNSVPQERVRNIFPNNMPEPSAVMDGAWVYDPRTNQDPDDPETWAFSANLALHRLDHLTHVSGGRLAKTDLYMPDWMAAADEADEVVLNRDDEEEPRYHGGMWYRYENDQVEVGRLLDEAGEMVLYERADGKIGVHPGALVMPDVRITKNDISNFRYDANRRVATTVLAVRGRFTDPDAVYNTVDAATYGDPYAGGDDTQRTKTVDNQVVQYHNHMQRLQKLAMTRANASRVSVTIDFDVTGPTRNIRYRRFVRVHYPERGLDEAIVEIIGRPKLSLINLTYTFDGIVVPSTLYSFHAATEEGVKGGLGEEIEPTGVPVPDNFAIGVNTEVVAGGLTQAFGIASWDPLSDALTYELEYQLANESEAPESVMSKPGETEVRTPALRDGIEYRFRLRTESNGAHSDWTSYENEVAVADTTAPGPPEYFDSSIAGSDVTLSWTNANSENLQRSVLYRSNSPTFGSAIAIYTANGGIGESRSYEDQSLASGTYYWWLVSFNASGVPSSTVGPETQTI